MFRQQLYEEDVPSKQIELLNRLKNNKVCRITRYSWLLASQAMEEWSIPASLVFRLTSGPLLLTLESGLTVGFASLPEKTSVTVWLEKADENDQKYGVISEDSSDLFPVEACDSNYSEASICQLVGKQITSIQIIKKVPENLLVAQTPCEAGLIIGFENGDELVLSHGLHNNSDDFAIIFRQEILRSNIEGLQNISI